MNITTRTTVTMPVKWSENHEKKVEEDEFIIDGGKSAMMTMRRRPLADHSRLQLPATGNRKGTAANSRQFDGAGTC